MNLTDAERLANTLMRAHGLAGTWTFRFDRATRRFGCCKFQLRVISLSKHLVLLNGESEVRDTMLHEIAHAKAGPRAGHGPAWKTHAEAIGCTGTRCYDTASVQTPPRKFQGTCPSCGFTILRHKRTQISCGKCSDTFVPALRFVWTRNIASIS